MSKTTTIKVEKVINVDIEKVKNTLLNLDNYSRWWKDYRLKYDSDYETLNFQSLSFIDLKLNLIEKGDNFIKFKYTKGPFLGVGFWEFREFQIGKTYVSYTIVISGRNWLIDIIKSTPFFKWKHKNDISQLISQIEKQ